MYNYQSGLVLARSIGAQWREADLQDILVYDIFNRFTQVYITLTNAVLDAPVHVDMNQLRARYSSYDGTLRNWLIDIGNDALPTVETLPDATIRYAKYSDAFYSGYKVDTTKIGMGSPENLTPVDRIDLKITRPGSDTDLSLIHKYCLVSVNGFYHRTDTDNAYTYVVNGRKSLEKCRENQVGILSFLDVGKVTQIPIEEDKIYAQDDTSDLKTRAYFWVDHDFTNKSVALVLGGYLIFPEEGVFWQTGERTFAVNFNAMPLIERLFESSIYLNLESLNLDFHQNIHDLINVQEFLSDETLKKYMTMSQSFLVVIDTPYIFTNRIHLRECNMPGMFTAYQDPTYPLIVNYGKVAEYWKTKEDGFWAVNVKDSFLRNFVFTSRPEAQLQTVSSANIPTKEFLHSRGFLLQIGTYK
jgi:hypothetical protein